MFCWPAHEAIRQARREGYTARMLPAVSALDCLFADLGLDPATSGCQSYEATEFLKNGRNANPSSLLILWQIGVIGVPVFTTKGYDRSALPLLIERLCRIYKPDHEVIVYLAPIQLHGESIVKRLPLGQLAKTPLVPSATLCIPPSRPARPDVKVQQHLNLALPEEDPPRRTIKRRNARSKSARSGLARPTYQSQARHAR
jgi:hypothetical protein